jgi:hypothetical protein
VEQLVFEGAMNGPMFLAWVKRALSNAQAGEAVLMALKAAGVGGNQAAGVRLIYLSPDVNPRGLEQVKAHLRKALITSTGCTPQV